MPSKAIVELLDAKCVISKQEFADVLTLAKIGRSTGVVAVLGEIAAQVAPKAPPALRAIDGGKQDDPDEGPDPA